MPSSTAITATTTSGITSLPYYYSGIDLAPSVSTTAYTFTSNLAGVPLSVLRNFAATTASNSLTYNIDTGTVNADYNTDALQYVVNSGFIPSKSPVEIRHSNLKQRLARQLAPAVITKKYFDEEAFAKLSPAEAKALSLLKSLIDRNSWRRYLKTSQLHVQAPSGLVYSISKYHSHLHVFDPRTKQKVAELCIRSKTAITPTDEVIGKLMFVLHDEPQLWLKANRYMKYPASNNHLDRLDLILADLRKVA